jgi:hypothetical protein
MDSCLPNSFAGFLLLTRRLAPRGLRTGRRPERRGGADNSDGAPRACHQRCKIRCTLGQRRVCRRALGPSPERRHPEPVAHPVGGERRPDRAATSEIGLRYQRYSKSRTVRAWRSGRHRACSRWSPLHNRNSRSLAWIARPGRTRTQRLNTSMGRPCLSPGRIVWPALTFRLQCAHLAVGSDG